jgi:hypothetical protein
MNFLTITMAAFFMLAYADVPQVNSLRQPAPTAAFPADVEISPFGGDAVVVDADSQSGAATGQSGSKSSTLQESSKLTLLRYVSGEYAKALKALPAGKDGFIVHVGQPMDDNMLDRQVVSHGAAVNSGDRVQITKLEFGAKQIVVDLNGGGRGKKRLRDRIHLEMGGNFPTTTSTSTTPQDAGPPGLQPGMGSTLYLDFAQAVPDLSPDDLKKLLAPFMDFTRQRSASVQWVDTLPPELRKAIQERIAVVGMDREEVVAAIGKPEHKVRERDQEGNDIEDWIYGQPPSKTVFVRFTGNRVTSVKQFPQ